MHEYYVIESGYDENRLTKQNHSITLQNTDRQGKLLNKTHTDKHTQGADKSLARPTSRFILFDGENISFDASLVIYINSTNIPPIMIINRIYETQNLLSL